MTSLGHDRRFALTFGLAIAVAAGVVLLSSPAEGQTFSVLHYFTGGSDGGNPNASITVGGSGILYGTATGDGPPGSIGTVFKLTQKGSAWVLDPLHEFTGPPDGSYPLAGVTIGPNGVLYGTTSFGGSFGNAGFGYGTVFEVQPPPTVCKTAICYWNETVLHAFGESPNDGSIPEYGNVIFDQAGNMYGTTTTDDGASCGTVWELSPSAGGWTESVLYQFTDGADGCSPYGGVIFDSAGNLYGVSANGGVGLGTLFQLSPSNGGWTEHTLLEFNGESGIHPYGTLIMDQAGNLYGTARDNGPNGGGTVFEFSPSNGGWTFTLLYAFSSNACGPMAGLTLGPDGNLYGVCRTGGMNRNGWVFELPTNCNQTCTPNVVHDFNFTDGADPEAPVTFDANGNMYGTTVAGGMGNCSSDPGECGVVWEITP